MRKHNIISIDVHTLAAHGFTSTENSNGNTIPGLAVLLRMVEKLLQEIGGRGKFTGEERKTLLNDLRRWVKHTWIFAAVEIRNKNTELCGIITLSESFSLFACGSYGIINELFVEKKFRRQGLGKKLLNRAKILAVQQGWLRLDVASPIGSISASDTDSSVEKHARHFYLSQGFRLVAEKLKWENT